MVQAFNSSVVADGIVDAMTAIGRAVRNSNRSTVDQGSFYLLHLLAQGKEQRLTQLAAAAELDCSTVSRHLRSLEASGLVSNEPDPVDGRAKLFRLTEAGSGQLSRARAERRSVLTERLAAWPAEDIKQLEVLLTRFAREVTQAVDQNQQQTSREDHGA